MISRLFTILSLFGIFIQITALQSDHQFAANARVPVLVNNVGPFHNPAESYKYYDTLPYCQPEVDKADEAINQLISEQDTNLGEILAGDRRRLSAYVIEYKQTVDFKPLCKPDLTTSQINQFIDAIRNHFVFEMFVDDLPIKGFVGEMDEATQWFDEHASAGNKHQHNDSTVYLFTHFDFTISHNDADVIVGVSLTTDPRRRVALTRDQAKSVEFSYSVHWQKVSIDSDARAEYHASQGYAESSMEIHWLSIINSFVLVLLLTAFLAVILMRVLHKDVARYMELDDSEEGMEDEDEVGWKLVHGDVFRAPKHTLILSAAIGNGAQMFALVSSVLFLSLWGAFYPGNRGALYTAAVFLYAATAFIAGWVGTRLYLQLGGTKWALQSILTACLFSVPFFFTFSVINTVAWSYGSSSALPASTIMLVITVYMLISLPLTIFGSMRARHNVGSFDAPCKTNRVEREIPKSPVYRSQLIHAFIGGFLPFSAIYIELHYIFVAIYGPRVYTLFGILTLAFVMLNIVTAFINIALTYFQLASEDYRWWWRSFLTGATVGGFMYAYACFYYFYRSEMSGVLQATFFFGYLSMVSYAFALMLGTVSYFSAQTFVKHIYRSIKID